MVTQTRNVTKSLAGMEDLQQLRGPHTQTRNGEAVIVHGIDVPYAVGTVADMQALDVTKFQYARVYSSAASYTDYFYDAESTLGESSDTGIGSWFEKVYNLTEGTEEELTEGIASTTRWWSPKTLARWVVQFFVRNKNTIADLRNFEPLIDKQSVNVVGHTLPGIGGDMFWHDASDTTSADNNGTVIRTAVGDKCWRRKEKGYVTPEDFGYISSLENHDVLFNTFLSSDCDSVCKNKLEFNLTKIFTVSNSNKNIDLGGSIINWNGTDDIGNNDRALGVINVKPTADKVFVELLTSGISAGNSYFISNSGVSYSVGDFVVLSGKEAGDNETGIFPSIYRMVEVTRVAGNTIYIDTTFGWSVAAGVVSVYSVEPVINTHVGNFHLNDNQVVTPSVDTNTPAPTIERNKAVCGVAATNLAKGSVKNVTSYGGKFPLTKTSMCLDLELEAINAVDPDWFAGGEGYTVQVGSSSRVSVSGANGTGCRHVVDFTASAFCTVEDSHDFSPKQNAFITHGEFEHDIHYERCHGAVFSPASAGYSFGNYAHTITAKDCKFKQLAGNSIDITFTDCEIGLISLAKYADVNFIRTSIAEFFLFPADVTRLATLDTKTVGKSIGTFYLDEGSSLNIENGRGEPGNYIGGFTTVIIKGKLGTNRADCPTLTFNAIRDVSLVGAKPTNVRARLWDDCGSVLINGVKVRHDRTVGGPFLYSRLLTGGQVDVKVVASVFDMNINGGTSGRAIGLVPSGESSPASAEMSVLLEGNTYINDGASEVRSDVNYIITKLRDRNNSETVTQTNIADAALYVDDDTSAIKGSTGGPAIRSGSVWIDLT